MKVVFKEMVCRANDSDSWGKLCVCICGLYVPDAYELAFRFSGVTYRCS